MFYVPCVTLVYLILWTFDGCLCEGVIPDEMNFGHLGRSTIGMRKNLVNLSRPKASAKSHPAEE